MNTRMNTKYTLIDLLKPALIITMVLLISACGSSEYEETRGSTGKPPVVTPGTPPIIQPGIDTPISGLSEPIGYPFSVLGTLTAPFNIQDIDHIETDTILRIRVTATDGGRINVNGYGFAPMYNCAKFTIFINGKAVWTTKKLKVEGSNSSVPGCSDAVASDYKDFDLKVANSVGPYDIQVGNPLYDYYCTYGGFGCPLKPPYFTHYINGRLDVQTNNTSSL